MLNTATPIWIKSDCRKNERIEFKSSVVLNENTDKSYRFKLFAVDRYHLYVNDHWVAYGPVRSHPGHDRYDAVEISSLLQKGINTFHVVVHYWGEGTFQSFVRYPLLCAVLEDENGAIVHQTDTGWQARRLGEVVSATPRIACQLSFEEQIDAMKVDSTSYDNAVEVSGLILNALERDIPHFVKECWHPVLSQSLGSEQLKQRLLLSLSGRPYLLPGDLGCNNESVCGVFAARFEVKEPGSFTIRMSSIYGGIPKIYLNGEAVVLAQDTFDHAARIELNDGRYLILCEWLGATHDLDFSLLIEGQSSIRRLTWNDYEGATWLFSKKMASRCAELQSADFDSSHCEDDLVVVRPEETPLNDVYMEMTHRVYESSEQRLPDLPFVCVIEDSQAFKRYVFDFGQAGFGFIEVEVDAAGGTILQGMGVEGKNLGKLQFTELANNSFQYICKEGRQSFRSGVPRGFRYLVLDVKSSGRMVRIEGMRFHQHTFPWTPLGRFYSDHSRLNQIYELCQHTLRVSTADTFIDATYEQALWVGDFASMILPVHFYVQGESSMPRRCLRLAAESLERLPLVNSQVPSSWENRMIPNWSFFWAVGVKDYVLFSGDLDFGKEMLPYLSKQAAFVKDSLNAEGVFEMHENVWHFLDWDHSDAGQQTADRAAVYAHENCLAVASFKASAQVAEWCDDLEHATEFWTLAERIEQATTRHFWNDKEKAFTESVNKDGQCSTRFSTSTQICALIADMHVAKSNCLASRVLKVPKSWSPTGTPWMWALGAFYARDKVSGHELVRGIVAEWGRMLDTGATAGWEMFEGNHRAGLATRSWAHGWSAGPAWLLPAVILGIRPTSPGWKTFTEKPIASGIRFAEATIPTPSGNILAQYTCHDPEEPLLKAVRQTN